MFEMKPDSIFEKQRKRRSSRTTGLSHKDAWINYLLFRTMPQEKYSIYDWQAAVNPLLTPDEVADDGVMSSKSSVFSGFHNPFGSDRSLSGSTNPRPEIVHRSASHQGHQSRQYHYTHAPATRERPSAMISPSPSLRSRRSDLSSQASSQPPHVSFRSSQAHSFTTTLPSDLPSPASTSGYDNPLIEGWTSAQGRSSALSSHTRGSNSIASAVAPIPSASSTPPGHRETILDRAFQMQCIPGSERMPEKQDERISSLARFEALMREADERKIAQSTAKQPSRETPNWDLEEESEESSEGEPDADMEEELGEELDEELDESLDESLDDEDEFEMSDEEVTIPPPAQRVLSYTSGGRTPVLSPGTPGTPCSGAPRSPLIPFINSQAMSALQGTSPSVARPRAGSTNSSSRPRSSRPSSYGFRSRSTSTNAVPLFRDRDSTNSTLRGDFSDSSERRSSSRSIQRVSFQEFAKRLSSSSSLLMARRIDSPASGRDGSIRDSGEYEVDNNEFVDRPSTRFKPARDSNGGRNLKCRWRDSVGVFDSE